MNIYKTTSSKFILLLIVSILISALLAYAIIVSSEKLNIFTVIIFLINAYVLVSLFLEYKNIQEQRIENLIKFAEVRGYDFVKKPSDSQVTKFKDFKAMSKSLLPYGMHSFMNLFTPEISTEDGNNEKPSIVTISTTISAGESSSTYYTQVYKFKLKSEIPIFYLAGGHHFSFSNLFRNKNIFKGIKELKEIDIQKFNFPKNKYKLYSSDETIKDFFTKEFINLLNTGLRKKKETLYIESNGKEVIFYTLYKRHTLQGMDFFINLFRVLIKSLNI